MVRQIIWTERAQKERKEIFTFWNAHNKSSFYSRKLNDLIIESLKLICIHPFMGKPTNRENVRLKIMKAYLIIYEITPKEIVALSIWDSRQDPEDK